MAVIEVVTQIDAPPEVCFQLALSIDFHAVSTQQTQEQIVGDVKTGILKLGDSVTFRARHFGVWQTLTSQITELRAPHFFCDVMQRGAFKWMRHAHHFEPTASGTRMRDVFAFRSPLGWLGRAVDVLVLKRHLRHFLQERGAALKRYAENGEWQQFLPSAAYGQ